MKLGRDLCVAVMVLGLSLMACKQLGGGDSEGDKEGDKASEESKSGDKKAEESGSSGDSIGVPACDEYLTKYEKCISSKVPEAGRAQMKASMDTMRKSWKQAASTPAGKAGLEAGCKQALEAAKQATAAYGCEW